MRHHHHQQETRTDWVGYRLDHTTMTICPQEVEVEQPAAARAHGRQREVSLG